MGDTFGGDNRANPELTGSPLREEKLLAPRGDHAPRTRGHRTLNKEENTWNVYTAQEPSESHMSWLMWLRQASSASSQAAGWNAARMAEKKGEGGGETPLSPSPKLEEMKTAVSEASSSSFLTCGLRADPQTALPGAHSAQASLRGLLWEWAFIQRSPRLFWILEHRTCASRMSVLPTPTSFLQTRDLFQPSVTAPRSWLATPSCIWPFQALAFIIKIIAKTLTLNFSLMTAYA